jgi:hypothetical protein
VTPNRTRFSILARGLNRERGAMNANERAWSQVLAIDPAVAAYRFEVMSFRYSHPAKGQPSRFTPDFMVLYNDGRVCFDDVKSGGKFDNEASLVRIAACAELYPWFIFRRVTPIAKKRGGGWKVREC